MISRRNLILVPALALVAGAAGVVVTNRLTYTVTVTPKIDLGDGQAVTIKEFDGRLDYALQFDEFNSPSIDELRERDPEGFAQASAAEEPEAMHDWVAGVRQVIWIEKHGAPFELRGR